MAPLTIYKSVSIVGAGARAVSIFQESSPANRVFFVEPNPRSKVVPTVTISGLSIVFGHANANNGYFGGDILNEATLTLNEDDITNGTARRRLGRRHLQRRRHAHPDSLARGEQHQHQSQRRRRLGRDPERRTQPGDRSGREADRRRFDDHRQQRRAWRRHLQLGRHRQHDLDRQLDDREQRGGARGTEGGGLLASEGTISVENSIVSGNIVEEPLTGERIPSNCGNSGISSLGHNIQSAADCTFTATGDLKNIEPGFLSSGLQDNGGNTDTLALEATSPAVDAIPSGAPGCSATDQRDIARPQGTGCDIGAYELFQPIEGQQFSEVVGAASPRAGTTPTINWGDGTSPSSGKVDANTGQLTGTHTYVNEGVYHASFTYTNSDGFPETRPFDVKVQDAPLTAVPGYR